MARNGTAKPEGRVAEHLQPKGPNFVHSRNNFGNFDFGVCFGCCTTPTGGEHDFNEWLENLPEKVFNCKRAANIYQPTEGDPPKVKPEEVEAAVLKLTNDIKWVKCQGDGTLRVRYSVIFFKIIQW